MLFRSYQVRANTSFNVRDWLRVGENLTYAFTKDNGLNSSGAESNPYSWTYRASPYVPVYDIAGNFAGSKFAGTGTSRTRLPIKREIRIITIHITAYLVTYGQRPILSRD